MMKLQLIIIGLRVTFIGCIVDLMKRDLNIDLSYDNPESMTSKRSTIDSETKFQETKHWFNHFWYTKPQYTRRRTYATKENFNTVEKSYDDSDESDLTHETSTHDSIMWPSIFWYITSPTQKAENKELENGDLTPNDIKVYKFVKRAVKNVINQLATLVELGHSRVKSAIKSNPFMVETGETFNALASS